MSKIRSLPWKNKSKNKNKSSPSICCSGIKNKGGREESSSRKQLSSTELWQMCSSQSRGDAPQPSLSSWRPLGTPGLPQQQLLCLEPRGWGRSSLQGHGGAEPAALPGDTSGLCLQSTWLWSGSLRAHLADEMRLFSAPPALVQDAGRHCCGQRVEGSWNKLLPKGKGRERNTGLHEKDTTTQEISLKLCSLELRQLKEGTNKQKQTPHHQRAPKPLPQLLCPLELLSKPGSPVCIMQERGIPALPELQTTLTPHISPFPKQGPSLAPCSQLGFT